MLGAKRALSTVRLNKAAALLALIAILVHSLVPAGWMPAFALSQAQGLSVVICTPAGVSHVVLGEDGKPVQQAPDQDQTHNHDHPCCPCGWARPLVPPANVVAFLIAIKTEQAVVFAQPEHPLLRFVRSPQSPRGPPTSI